MLAVSAYRLNERATWRELLSALLVVTGVAGISLAALAQGSRHAGGAILIAALIVLGMAALLPTLSPRAGPSPGALLATGAGLVYAWDGLATKFTADDLSRER